MVFAVFSTFFTHETLRISQVVFTRVYQTLIDRSYRSTPLIQFCYGFAKVLPTFTSLPEKCGA